MPSKVDPKEYANTETAQVTRSEVENLLYEEARLLDQWRLDEWLGLLTDDATYEVPTTNRPAGNSKEDLFLVADDPVRLRSRVRQLMGRTAWIEYPRSRTRRIVGNAEIAKTEGDLTHITANFIIYRIRYGINAPYIGHYEHVLIRDNDRLKIKKRKAVLDMESLDPHGSVAFIL